MKKKVLVFFSLTWCIANQNLAQSNVQSDIDYGTSAFCSPSTSSLVFKPQVKVKGGVFSVTPTGKGVSVNASTGDLTIAVGAGGEYEIAYSFGSTGVDAYRVVNSTIPTGYIFLDLGSGFNTQASLAFMSMGSNGKAQISQIKVDHTSRSVELPIVGNIPGTTDFSAPHVAYPPAGLGLDDRIYGTAGGNIYYMLASTGQNKRVGTIYIESNGKSLTTKATSYQLTFDALGNLYYTQDLGNVYRVPLSELQRAEANADNYNYKLKWDAKLILLNNGQVAPPSGGDLIFDDQNYLIIVGNFSNSPTVFKAEQTKSTNATVADGYAYQSVTYSVIQKFDVLANAGRPTGIFRDAENCVYYSLVNDQTALYRLFGMTAGCASQGTIKQKITIYPKSVAAKLVYPTICPANGFFTPQINGAGVIGALTVNKTGLDIQAGTGVVNISKSLPGTYTITNAINASGGCAASSQSFDVTIARPSVSAQNVTVCPEGTAAMSQVLLNPVASNNYQVFSLDNQIVSNSDVINIGKWKIVATDKTSQCFSEALFDVLGRNTPTISVTNPSVCGKNPFDLNKLLIDVDGKGLVGYTTQFLQQGKPISNINAVLPGAYALKLTQQSSNCVLPAVDFSIESTIEDKTTFAMTNNICQGEDIVVQTAPATLGGIFSYAISATNPVFSNNVGDGSVLNTNTGTVKNAKANTTYQIRYSTKGTTNLCPAEFINTVEVKPVVLCPQNVPVTLHPIAGTCLATYVWGDVSQVNPCGVLDQIDVTQASTVVYTTKTPSVQSWNGFQAGLDYEVSFLYKHASATAVCKASVSVKDIEAPILTCPTVSTPYKEGDTYPDLTKLPGYVSSDNCAITSLTQSPALGGKFSAVGEFVFNLTAIDKAGNKSTCKTAVNVIGNTPVNCPTEVTGSLSDLCNSTVPDLRRNLLDANPTLQSKITFPSNFQNPAPGSYVQGGVTNATVFYQIDNAAVQSCTVPLTFNDKTIPVCETKNISKFLEPAGNFILSLGDVLLSGHDNCTLSKDLVYTLSKSNFDCTNIGENTVSIQVKDQAGNVGTCLAKVTLADNIAPEIICPADIITHINSTKTEKSKKRTTQVNNKSLLCDISIDSPVLQATDKCGIASISYEVKNEQLAIVQALQNLSNGQSTVNFTLQEGAYNVNWIAKDKSGNSKSCVQNVTIVDDMALDCAAIFPALQTTLSGADCVAQIDFAPTLPACYTVFNNKNDKSSFVKEVFEITPTRTQSGVKIEIPNEVTWTIISPNGHTLACVQAVTVAKNIAPVLDCPTTGLTTLSVDAQCRVPNYNPYASVAGCSASQEPLLQVYEQGVANPIQKTSEGYVLDLNKTNNYTVAFTAQDIRGNASTCNYQVALIDDIKPEVSLDGTIAVSIQNCLGNVDITLPVFRDNCKNSLTINYKITNKATGAILEQGKTGITQSKMLLSNLPLGDYMLEVTAVDAQNNQALVQYDFSVQSYSTPKVRNLSNDQQFNNDLYLCSGTVNWSVEAQDECPVYFRQKGTNVELGVIPASLSFETKNFSISEVPVGVSNFVFEFFNKDLNGNPINITERNSKMTVKDAEAPELPPYQDILAKRTQTDCKVGEIVTFLTIASENCAIQEVTATPNSGSTFLVGTTPVKVTAIDQAGNKTEKTFNVTVPDEYVLKACPKDTVLQSNVDCGALINYTQPYLENCQGDKQNLTLTAGFTNTDTFPIGNTLVEYTKTLAGKNYACKFLAQVIDNQPPVLTCPKNQNETSPYTVPSIDLAYILSHGGSVVDNCGSGYNISQTNAPIALGLQDQKISLTYTDKNGATSSCSFLVFIDQNIDCDLQKANQDMLQITAGNCDIALPDYTQMVINNITNASTLPILNLQVLQTPAPNSKILAGETDITFEVQIEIVAGSPTTNYCVSKVQVQDLQKPTVLCKPSLDVDISAGAITLLPSQIDAGSVAACPNYVLSYALIGKNYFDCTDVKANNYTDITLQVQDNLGNQSSCITKVHAIDNSKITLSCPKDQELYMPSNACSAMYFVDTNAVQIDRASACAQGVYQYQVTRSDGTVMDKNQDNIFVPGNFTLTYQVQDMYSGQNATCVQNITVYDKVPPTFTNCPNNMTVNASPSTCDATVNFDVQAITNCGVPTISQLEGLSSGSKFVPGFYSQVFQAIDENGNEAFCKFVIEVVDIAPATLQGIEDVVTLQVSSDVCSVPYPWNVQAQDACGVVDLMWSDGTELVHETGTQSVNTYNFQLGYTEIMFSAIDKGGYTTSQKMQVTVQDLIAPVINLQDANGMNMGCVDVILQPKQSCDTLWNEVYFRDNCTPLQYLDIQYQRIDGANITTNPDDVYAVGKTYQNQYVVTDAEGNSSTCNFKVTVEDVVAPVVQMSQNTYIWQTDAQCKPIKIPLDEIANWQDCTALDMNGTAPDGKPYFTRIEPNYQVNGFDPNGIQNVMSYVFYDGVNTSTATANIILQDDIAPTLQCPADMVINTGPDRCGIPVTWSEPLLQDNCSASVNLTKSLQITSVHNPNNTDLAGQTVKNGDVFYHGTTHIVYTAQDDSGNVGTCSFDVQIIDNVLPKVSCPDKIELDNEQGQSGATVTYSFTALDNCGIKSQTLLDGKESGSFFEIGSTTVTWEFESFYSGQKATCTFPVIVKDVEKPIMSRCSDFIAQIQSSKKKKLKAVDVCQTQVFYPIPTASDNYVDPVTMRSILGLNQIEGKPVGAIFGIGRTPVSFEAIDLAGNRSVCNMDIVVDKTIPPSIVCKTGFTSCSSEVKIADLYESADDICGLARIENSVDNTANTTFTLPVGKTEVELTAYDKGSLSASCKIPVEILPIQNVEFNYDVPEFLSSLGRITPVIQGEVGGVFSIEPNRLSINPSTGEINLRESRQDELWKVTYTSPNKCNVKTLEFTVQVKLNVPEGINTQGTGQNTRWKVDGITEFPNNSVKIINRWGDVVYEKKNYSDEFEGYSNVKGAVGKKLTEGTYFYMIDLGEGDKPITGALEVR